MLDLIAPRHAPRHLSTTTKASFNKTSFILSSPCQGLNDLMNLEIIGANCRANTYTHTNTRTNTHRLSLSL